MWWLLSMVLCISLFGGCLMTGKIVSLLVRHSTIKFKQLCSHGALFLFFFLAFFRFAQWENFFVDVRLSFCLFLLLLLLWLVDSVGVSFHFSAFSVYIFFPLHSLPNHTVCANLRVCFNSIAALSLYDFFLSAFWYKTFIVGRFCVTNTFTYSSRLIFFLYVFVSRFFFFCCCYFFRFRVFFFFCCVQEFISATFFVALPSIWWSVCILSSLAFSLLTIRRDTSNSCFVCMATNRIYMSVRVVVYV